MRTAIRMLAAASVLAGLFTSVRAQEVFNPGDGVSLPAVVTSVHPRYTPEAMAARIEGKVTLAVVVKADGKVGDVAVERSLGAGLDQEAVDAAKQWTFNPGTKDGKAVAVRVHLEMAFTLK